MLGALYFMVQGGYHAVVPTHIDWLMRNDWSQHYLGWAFFRHAAWQWPLGALPNLGYPLGTTVAYTDANPLMSLMLRPWAMVLPEPFQALGLFMTLCFALQGYMGAHLAQRLGAKAWQAVACAGLFITAPILLHRIDHDTLMAHWTLLGALALAFTPQPSALQPTPTPRAFVAQAVGLSVMTLTIHPYLLAMVLPVVVVALLAQAGPQGLLHHKGAALACGLCALCLLGMAALLGYVGRSEAAGSDGFGFYAADLTAFYNPMGWSRLLPSLPHHRGQTYEGFGYMGAGTLGLVACALGLALRHRPTCHRPWLAAALVCVACGAGLFALATPWCLWGKPWLDVPFLFAKLQPLTTMFRASGRFLWVPYYMAMACAMGIVVRCVRPQAVTWVVVAALALQLTDGMPQHVRTRLTTDPHAVMDAAVWQTLRGDYDHIALVPPHFHGSHVQCNPKGYRDKIEMPPGFLAAQMGMTINSAYVARADPNKVAAYCQSFAQAIDQGHLDSRTVYLVAPDYLAWFTSRGIPVHCWQANAYTGCVTDDRNTHVIQNLREHAGHQLR